ncbi:uncharacterized protein EV422DRAFT_369159 [Fimicolochytrium jonesii]|uniref:uncharacterized protein n=1 Tax=Fimicolochytrium jonesii TaxID=1396493 RepID=UPI0022FEFCFF|nr:uncharacterized protein EV422DRAFT_369159 [Fimicolochytrium jonesii]KAI8823768.1 hypothetical protein EV422DRAFT_369159 [Fimicolochytrium jonesii]
MKKVDDEPKVVVVTGASSGIGAALALEYARPSTHIHIIARNKERLDKVAHAIHLAGGTPHIHQLDLSLPSPQPITDLINRIDAEHGGIDLVIPAAGNIGLGEDGEGETKWDAAMAEKMVDLNVRGAARVIFAAWERMKERRKGKICVIASIAAWGGPGNFALYCSSKAYLYRFALHLRQISIPYNIQVTTVCPGLIDSAMTTSMRKLGSIVPKPLHSSPAKLAVHVRKAVKENRGVTSWPYHQGVAQYAFRGLNPVCEEIAVWVGVVSGGASDVLT